MWFKAKYFTFEDLQLFSVLEQGGNWSHLQSDPVSGLLRCIVFVNMDALRCAYSNDWSDFWHKEDLCSGGNFLSHSYAFVFSKLLRVREHPWFNTEGIWHSSEKTQVFVQRAVNLWSTGVSLLLTLITQVYNFNYSF